MKDTFFTQILKVQGGIQKVILDFSELSGYQTAIGVLA